MNLDAGQLRTVLLDYFTILVLKCSFPEACQSITSPTTRWLGVETCMDSDCTSPFAIH
jgi:hypothetical protein